MINCTSFFYDCKVNSRMSQLMLLTIALLVPTIDVLAVPAEEIVDGNDQQNQCGMNESKFLYFSMSNMDNVSLQFHYILLKIYIVE